MISNVNMRIFPTLFPTVLRTTPFTSPGRISPGAERGTWQTEHTAACRRAISWAHLHFAKLGKTRTKLVS